MIKILKRGGIHRTKHEFGLFNRKFKPKSNKKRALIVWRGVYGKNLFMGLGIPTHCRPLKKLTRHPFLQRQAFKHLGSCMAHQVRRASERPGFVRRLFEMQQDTSNQLFKPEDFKPVTDGPVPNFVVELVDEHFCFLDVVEPEMILELYADIVSRMPEGLIPQVGDYQSFDPSDKDGTTGSRVRIHKGKIVEVQQLPTKWEGPYKGSVDPEPKPNPYSMGFNRYVTGKVSGDTVLKPGEAVICLPDGTFEPFLRRGRGMTPHYGQPPEEDYADALRVAFEVPKELLDSEPKRPSMGYIPKGKISMAELRNLEPIYGLPELPIPPASEVPGRTITQINENTTLITDSFREPVLPEGKHGWCLVDTLDLVIQPGPKPVVEGDVERKTSKTVNESDTEDGVKHDPEA